ncbi:MAG: ATP-dependent 6-phosphofructokinase [Candidatus Paracaedibacteraceae bacterium]|nr:ATP-dependent 6-phosphofructokinase [Candidatus Paracaedibacteraceae bacterium]
MIKRIGVLTSGGDCAGLNAILRAITYYAHQAHGWEVIGIKNGTTGLIKRPIETVTLTPSSFDNSLLRSGGTMLGSTNKADPFNFPNPDGTRTDRSDDLIEAYHSLALDALIAIGGDGSMRIMRDLAQKGNLNLITIPKTIDNDLGHTEISIGYSTALEIATEALDRLQPTAESHQRVIVLEVMGRDAGHIALAAGIAGGADAIIIPEIPYSLDNMCKKIKELWDNGHTFALIIVAEGAHKENGALATIEIEAGNRPRYGGIGQYISEKIEAMTGAETRVTVLGHVQRGGQPNALDRLVASSFGVRAVDLVFEGKFDRMVAWQNRNVVDVPIHDAIEQYQSVSLDDVLVKTAKGLGIYIGDV